ncbi:aldehyde dehydrogenase family protein [Elusimicrobiota bacterium]
MSQEFKNYIGGKWVGSGSGEKIDNINPANKSEVTSIFQKGTKDDAAAAVKAAGEAYPAWKKIPPAKRARYVAKVLELAKNESDELARIMTLEEGKILAEAKGEIAKGNTLLEWFAGEGLRLMGISAYSELPDNMLYTVRKPLGVVSLITPWNFPWAIPCWKLAPALIAGNTVVFKPASSTPWLATKMVEFFEKAGLPEGVLNLVVGPGSSVGEELLNNEAVKAISFTGSNEIGQHVNEIAAKRLAKVTLEMGGKNACIILGDADLELALGGVIKGAFGNAGQRCTATSRLILIDSIADKFMDMLVPKVKEIKVGPGLDPTSNMGPVADETQYKSVLDYIEIGKKEADLITGGEAVKREDSDGFFVAPTIFDNVTKEMRIHQEEIFGPVLSVIRVKSYEEAIEVANNTRYGLSSAIFTSNINTAMKFVEDIEAGMTHINSPTIGGEAQVPFGGIKATGVGEREMAKEGINFFTEQLTVFIDYTGGIRQSNIY